MLVNRVPLHLNFYSILNHILGSPIHLCREVLGNPWGVVLDWQIEMCIGKSGYVLGKFNCELEANMKKRHMIEPRKDFRKLYNDFLLR